MIVRTCRRDTVTRREFVHRLAALAGAVVGSRFIPITALAAEEGPLVSVATSSDHRKAVRTAVEMLGSMKSFISKGDRVLLKPNISWDRLPEQAANSNPDVVNEVVKMCFEAGAGTVQVLDRTCNNATRCYDRSGVAAAAGEAGAEVSFVSESRFRETPIPEGKVLKSWPVYRDALRADKLINLPVLKHHSMAVLSGGVKNMMGLLGGDRGKIHRDFPEKITDINTILVPSLTILDATRVLFRNGPQGGSLDDVRVLDTVLASTDIVAVDAVGTTLMGMKPEDLPYLTRASERGLGEHDLEKIRTERAELS
jgi:uncharacterized protein (DUF362 family)